MIPALEPLFPGEFAAYGEWLVAAEAPDSDVTVPVPALLEAGGLEPYLERMHPGFVPSARRAVVSQWSKFYFARLILPVATAAVQGWRVPVPPEPVGVAVGTGGDVQAFHLPGPGGLFEATPDGPFERFAHLLDDHLSPVVTALARHERLSARVLWSNAGNYLEFVIGRLAEAGLSPGGVDDAYALLAASRRPDGTRNPLHQPVRYLDVPDGEGGRRSWRQRRMCCIRDLLPEYGLCGNCPRLAAPPPGE
ncbi:siderophore-iron reductase FhuF [Arhodomonas aquaeolei]|uniref:siderophore-iron reductase FhuF n=1 Tax=Arhodomonas aquaeolei TaxID=2369 RepID=UPI00036405BF|nr:siderophore-iron reductase FhuF [Arhodomonas aquaeolei]